MYLIFEFQLNELNYLIAHTFAFVENKPRQTEKSLQDHNHCGTKRLNVFLLCIPNVSKCFRLNVGF